MKKICVTLAALCLFVTACGSDQSSSNNGGSNIQSNGFNALPSATPGTTNNGQFGPEVMAIRCDYKRPGFGQNIDPNTLTFKMILDKNLGYGLNYSTQVFPIQQMAGTSVGSFCEIFTVTPYNGATWLVNATIKQVNPMQTGYYCDQITANQTFWTANEYFTDESAAINYSYQLQDARGVTSTWTRKIIFFVRAQLPDVSDNTLKNACLSYAQ